MHLHINWNNVKKLKQYSSENCRCSNCNHQGLPCFTFISCLFTLYQLLSFLFHVLFCIADNFHSICCRVWFLYRIYRIFEYFSMAQQIKVSLIEMDKPWDRALICGTQCTHCTHRKWMWILKTMMKQIKWIRFKRKIIKSKRKKMMKTIWLRWWTRNRRKECLHISKTNDSL